MDNAKIILIVGKDKQDYFTCPFCDGEFLFCYITGNRCAIDEIEKGKINYKLISQCPLYHRDVVVKMGKMDSGDFTHTKADGGS